MAEEQRRDDELASFTDALLDDARAEEGDRPPLAATVEMLAHTLGHRPPPASLRSRVRRCVAAEWPGPRPSLAERLRGLPGLLSRPGYRWAWATVAALAVVAVAAALILPAGIGETTGTLVGEVDTTVLVVVLALLLATVVVAAWLASRRR
jgi:anti-sigma-K factor RskA